MSRNLALAILVASAALAASIATSSANMNDGDRIEKGGAVVPCSLAGVNPAYHPEIFGNPAVAAREYGFVRSPDGTWHVGAGCGASGSPSATSAYAPGPESQKAIRQRKR